MAEDDLANDSRVCIGKLNIFASIDSRI